MKIVAMTLFPVKLPLKVPFETALHTVENKECILIKLENDSGLSGWGEAAPEKEITGDDFKTAYDVLINELEEQVIGQIIHNHEDFIVLLDKLSDYIKSSSTAVAAVDIALHDLWTRSKNIALFEYFNGDRKPLETSISIGIMETERIIDRIRSIVRSGGSVIKLKIGSDKDRDYALVKKVRDVFGDRIKLRLDANQGYDLSGALEMFEKFNEFDIEFIEQPLPSKNYSDLKILNKKSPIPVMADEAVNSIGDLQNIINNKICRRINIKIMKSGGLYQANKLIRVSYENNIDCMIGCMIETPIGISAGVHLASQNRAVKWTDLDGHLFLHDISNVFSGLKTDGSSNNISTGPGLGLRINEIILKKFLI